MLFNFFWLRPEQPFRLIPILCHGQREKASDDYLQTSLQEQAQASKNLNQKLAFKSFSTIGNENILNLSIETTNHKLQNTFRTAYPENGPCECSCFSLNICT